MGRPLVLLFLGTVVYGTVTLAMGLVFYVSRVVWDLLTLQGGLNALNPGAQNIPTWAALWFHLALIYFTLLGTFGLVYLAISVLRAPQVPRLAKPEPLPAGPHTLAVVIPAYNEEAAIAEVVEDFQRNRAIRWVIVFDNHSTDRTGEIAKAHGAIVVREERPGFGWGHSCTQGLKAALERTTADIIVLTEADRTYFGQDVGKLMPYLQDADMAVGTRGVWHYTDPDSQMDWFLTWGNKFLAVVLRLRFWDPIFFGQLQISDVGCTLRAIRRSSLEKIAPFLVDEGEPFTVYMMMVALSHGVSVVEVPVRFRKRVGESKMAGYNRWRASRIGLKVLWYIVSR